MSAWIGKRDALVEFVKYRSDLAVSRSGRSKFETTLGGSVREFRAPKTRRTWDVGVDFATARDSASFKALVLGTEPPWVWVDPNARVTNMLTPDQSLLVGGSWSGAGFTVGSSAVTADGVFANRTLVHPTGGTVDFTFAADGTADRPVVLEGKPVSWSAYARGTGVVRVTFLDWADQIITERSSEYNHGTMLRASISTTPPAGAVSVRLRVVGALQVGLPAFTWTSAPTEWSVGGGCNKASVDGFQETVRSASGLPNSDGRYSSISFVVRELG